MLLPNDSPLDIEDRDLLDRAARWPEYHALEDLTPAQLQELTRESGIDLATALLFDRILRSPQHRPFIDRMHAIQTAAPASSPIDAAIVVVPGAFYREYPHTGADGSAILAEAQRMGCQAERIPTRSVGTTTENGSLISDWLSTNADDRIVLFSLSKGGADVKMALAQPNAAHAFRNVIGWISLSGTLYGTPMIDWIQARRWAALLSRLVFWSRGRDYQFVNELRQRAGGELDFALSLPAHLQLFHIAGFPLTRHASDRRARRWHRRLASYGPNDSVMALSDLCQLPGKILPVWGADHYLRCRWTPKTLVRAMLQFLGEELDRSSTTDSAEMVVR